MGMNEQKYQTEKLVFFSLFWRQIFSFSTFIFFLPNSFVILCKKKKENLCYCFYHYYYLELTIQIDYYYYYKFIEVFNQKKKKFLRFFRGTFSQFDNLKKKFTLTNEWMKNIYSFTTTTTTKKSYFFSQQKLFNTECDYRKLIRNFFFLSLSEFILYINT